MYSVEVTNNNLVLQRVLEVACLVSLHTYKHTHRKLRIKPICKMKILYFISQKKVVEKWQILGHTPTF